MVGDKERHAKTLLNTLIRTDNLFMAFRVLASLPAFDKLTDIQAENDVLTVGIISTVRDYSAKVKTVLVSRISYNFCNSKILKPLPEIADFDLLCTSPSGSLQARLKTVGDKRYIIIFGRNTFDSFLVSHADFYKDEFFGRIAWAPSESAIAYIACNAKNEDFVNSID
jgi:hypothetical protein